MRHQIFHANPNNQDYRKCLEAKAFVEKYLQEALPLTSDAAVMEYACRAAKLEGLFIELGVFKGRTINFIAALNPSKTIYGFDSFQGLPEDWKRGDGIIVKKTFQLIDPDYLPSVLPNVQLVQGWFKDTLPTFHEKHPKEPIAFLHVDSDLYSSAKTAFTALRTRICPGTVLVFDEFYNYPGAKDHEQKAFFELLQEESLQARYLAYNVYHQQVVAQITTSV